MKRSILTFVMVFGALPGVAYAQLEELPAGGQDSYTATTLSFEMALGDLEGVTPESIRNLVMECSGPARIERSDPRGLEEGSELPAVIDTEIVSLELTCANGVRVRLNPEQRSTGQIQSTGDSFFDVFFQIEHPEFGELRNKDAARLQATLGETTQNGAIYFGVKEVQLFSPLGVFGRLVNLRFFFNFFPKPESRGEVSSVFSCFYECKKDIFQTSWLETTTLMLVNQRASGFIFADILFVDGNQRDIARTSTLLSPQDLDELNVCHTIDKAFGWVPPAGLIEVVLSFGRFSGVGAYGWVKNLTGKFPRSVAEPFLGTVTGVGKTECRLVGPNVVRPQDVRRKLPRVPFITPTLIEQTADPDRINS